MTLSCDAEELKEMKQEFNLLPYQVTDAVSGREYSLIGVEVSGISGVPKCSRNYT